MAVDLRAVAVRALGDLPAAAFAVDFLAAVDFAAPAFALVDLLAVDLLAVVFRVVGFFAVDLLAAALDVPVLALVDLVAAAFEAVPVLAFVDLLAVALPAPVLAAPALALVERAGVDLAELALALVDLDELALDAVAGVLAEADFDAEVFRTAISVGSLEIEGTCYTVDCFAEAPRGAKQWVMLREGPMVLEGAAKPRGGQATAHSSLAELFRSEGLETLGKATVSPFTIRRLCMDFRRSGQAEPLGSQVFDRITFHVSVPNRRI